MSRAIRSAFIHSKQATTGIVPLPWIEHRPVGWFQTLFRSRKRSQPSRPQTGGPFPSLKSDSGELPARKTPSSDRLPSLSSQADTLVNALRAATFAEPGPSIAQLSSGGAQQFLRQLLTDPQHPAADYRLHQTRVGNFPCVIVELPEPKTGGQSHYVGLLVTLSARKTPDVLTPQQVRFFTLEKRTDDVDDPATVLCEWTAKGERRSFGSGPVPRVERFLYALSGMAR